MVCLTGCETWTIQEGLVSPSVIEYPYSSLPDCLDKCLEMSICVAVDVSVVVCFVHTNVSDLAASFNTSGFTQYTLLDRNCQSSTTNTVTSQTSTQSTDFGK